MDTNELIEKLTRDLRPTKRLPSALFCFFVWAAVSALYILTIMQTSGGVRHAAPLAGGNISFLAENLLYAVAATAGVMAALRLRIPAEKIDARTRALLFTATGIWLLIILDTAVRAEDLPAHAHMYNDPRVRRCLPILMAAAAAPVALMFALLRQGGTTWRLWAGYAATLGAASLAALGVRYACATDNAAHLLVWHVLPVAACTVAGIAMGRAILRW